MGLFNSFFAKQNNGSELLYTENTLTNVEFDSEDISKIISSLDPNKAPS